MCTHVTTLDKAVTTTCFRLPGIMKLSNGTEVTSIDGEEGEDLMEHFRGYSDGLVRIGPSNYILTQAYTRFAENYLAFQFRSSDVLVVTYPKCGTTWTQEIIWTMLHNPDLDNPDGDLHLGTRSPFLEFDTLADTLTKKTGHNPTMVAALKAKDPTASPDHGLFLGLTKVARDRRVIKTHLPFSLLPANVLDICKAVFVARNPKDLVASYLHHHRLMTIHDFHGSDAEFVDYFCNGQLLYGPYENHLKEAWARKENKNLLFLFYEDIKRDPVSEIKKLNKFLGTNLSDKQVENVKQRSSFGSMKERLSDKVSDENEAVVEGLGINGLYHKELAKNVGFYRKGKSGAWKDDVSSDNSTKIDHYIADKITSQIPGLKFAFE
ncbi:Sulfotransferase domain [Trinorchestia longiramus]|nr:Sulfotransferase domain [Trinorchestia longiramus]